MTKRRDSVKVSARGVDIGGGSRVTVQSMLNRLPGDIEANVAQAVALERAGCEIIRVAVADRQAVALIPALRSAVRVPVVADIHFDYRIALACVEAGADKIRLNPGNIGADDRVKQVADACRAAGIPIRIGVNAGSLEKPLLQKYGGPTAEALCESALRHAELLEKHGFTDIVLSIKSSDVPVTVEAYRLVASRCAYPLHIGVTEAGTMRMGLIKSAAGIGALLLEGLGDTIRVSLTDEPLAEVAAGIDILKAAGVRREGPELVSCPTCGRARIDIIKLASEVEKALAGCTKNVKIAVMGCAVNGPGEAKEADIGIAGGDGVGLLFKKGEIVKKVPEGSIVEELLKELEHL
ncbi:MAG TPA: flavodoxin-dependent (E)-4-hydroxy-3-methylbut-2-enyl-diphosphate synthase [Clostridiales bacterium]|nr:MAG: 4-hydroxy-3-methylbut-2-en-1-yl diphosphate synthase [Firmicutes bacterium ADurb.Bin262]HQK73532.1 flavodoxin-dependent (E)-4-hydroxy-3-methylbut-2-enyl-diphosphate synthase [Clostridiales bacterium]